MQLGKKLVPTVIKVGAHMGAGRRLMTSLINMLKITKLESVGGEGSTVNSERVDGQQ